MERPGKSPKTTNAPDRGCGGAQPQRMGSMAAFGVFKGVEAVVAAAAGLRHSRGPGKARSAAVAKPSRSGWEA